MDILNSHTHLASSSISQDKCGLCYVNFHPHHMHALKLTKVMRDLCDLNVHVQTPSLKHNLGDYDTRWISPDNKDILGTHVQCTKEEREKT